MIHYVNQDGTYHSSQIGDTDPVPAGTFATTGTFKNSRDIWDFDTNKWIHYEFTNAEKRRQEMPSAIIQLEMQATDIVNGTNTWVELISALHVKYQEPIDGGSKIAKPTPDHTSEVDK